MKKLTYNKEIFWGKNKKSLERVFDIFVLAKNLFLYKAHFYF